MDIFRKADPEKIREFDKKNREYLYFECERCGCVFGQDTARLVWNKCPGCGHVCHYDDGKVDIRDILKED